MEQALSKLERLLRRQIYGALKDRSLRQLLQVYADPM
jgi:hypothetical protein